MGVRNHGPQPADGPGWQAWGKHGNVTYEVAPDERVPPREALCIIGGEQAVGKSASGPEPVHVANSAYA